jgi:ubiquinone/menaquinone biosynthesis C-methylase UbiE
VRASIAWSATVDREDYVEANREAWNRAAPHHKAHAQYEALAKGFANPGFSCLDEVATALLTEIGVVGRDVAQVCCNNARELLSVKGLGAARCVGFDISAAFLRQAEELAKIAGHACEFVETDAYRIPKRFNGAFDVVFTTVGVFGWMPDMTGFFATVRRLLKPGGRYFAYEQHPILDMFEFDETGAPARLAHSYFRREADRAAEGLDYYGYAQYDAPVNYWFLRPLSDVVGACLAAGLTLEHLAEYPHNISDETYDVYEDQAAQLPLCYTLIARKAA